VAQESRRGKGVPRKYGGRVSTHGRWALSEKCTYLSYEAVRDLHKAKFLKSMSASFSTNWKKRPRNREDRIKQKIH